MPVRVSTGFDRDELERQIEAPLRERMPAKVSGVLPSVDAITGPAKLLWRNSQEATHDLRHEPPFDRRGSGERTAAFPFQRKSKERERFRFAPEAFSEPRLGQ
jgi:hypothetical protein